MSLDHVIELDIECHLYSISDYLHHLSNQQFWLIGPKLDITVWYIWLNMVKNITSK